ncbi:hypothetical protein EQG68_02775 [Flavobacterium piscinae]|uniref:Uncharacterized protein n=1 Tax=Flavobacterium piscinae TaxID=2506424 RepID=A0A4Q1KYN6_9FLAO|nr:hypothetical protein [Flavobacterium piscinae]RXR34850.1 hypothetical protein EQG68_02775 [Flavobacterium piscinae]
MRLDENSGGVITLKEAQDLVRTYQTSNPEEVKGFFIGANHLKAILNQERCIGVRIYNAYEEESKTHTLVLIGVDGNENDMKEGVIVDRLVKCPPHCSGTVILD